MPTISCQQCREEPGPYGLPAVVVVRADGIPIGHILPLSDGSYSPDPYVTCPSLDDAIRHVLKTRPATGR